MTNTLFLLCSVITSLLSAWALGAEGRGDLALVTLWAYIAALIATFGLPYAHRFWTAHKPEWKPEIFTVTIVFTLLVGGIAVGLSEIIVPLYVGERSPEVMWLMRLFLLNIPVLMFNEMMRGMLEGAKLFGWLGAARLSFILTQAGGYLIFWAFDVLTLPIAVILITAGQILCVTIMFAGIWRELKLRWSWNFSVFRKELSYGFRSYPGILTEFAVLRLDQIILAGFASSFIFGLYTVAVSLAEITATLASSVADALMPEVASSNDQERSTALLAKSLRLTFYAHLLVLIPLWFAAPFVLQFVYGAEFVEATATLRVLFFASVVLSLGAIVISGLNGFGHPGLGTTARLASAVTTVAALFLLLPLWGMMGAAVASLIGYGVMLAVSLFWLWHKRGMNLWQSLRPRREDFSLIKIKRIFKLELIQPKSSEL